MKKGFTLIEVLIVVGIICIISAIILPALSRAREKSRQSTCANNLRQIALATQMYSADNSGQYPSWFNGFAIANPLPNSKPGIGWAVRISAYTKTNAIFQCPTEPTPGSDDPDASLIVGQPTFLDYGYNPWLSDEPESRFGMPTKTIAFKDDEPLPAWGMAHKWEVTHPESMRHSGGVNCAFVDGHVKWLPFGSIYMGGRNSDVDPFCKQFAAPATTCVY
jgi:prepilin-type N-terminal cleavage/methylation domain-containing protein/prepilin-type processing-associated H-X9-DG protein